MTHSCSGNAFLISNVVRLISLVKVKRVTIFTYSFFNADHKMANTGVD